MLASEYLRRMRPSARSKGRGRGLDTPRERACQLLLLMPKAYRELLHRDGHGGGSAAELVRGVESVGGGGRGSDDGGRSPDGADLRRDDVIGGASGSPRKSDAGAC
jgi:hypothetical protein